ATARAHGVGDARLDVPAEQELLALLERALHRGDLQQDVHAVGVVLEHALPPLHLALDPPQPAPRLALGLLVEHPIPPVGTIPPGPTAVKRRAAPCYCYIEMSWGNCSVKVSSPYGDFHDEPEGVAPRRTGDCGRGRPDQQSGGSRRPAHDAPAISAAQAALSRDGGGGTAPPKPRAPLAATPAGERGGPSPGAAARPVHGVQ